MSLTSSFRTLVLVVFSLCSPAAFAQASLALSSGTAAAGTTINLNLSLTSNGTQASGLQWNFTYSPADFTAITVVAGPSATGASKTLSCNGASGTYTCLLYGMNNDVVANGVVATATMTLSTGTSVSRAVQVTNAVASTAVGDTVATSATGGIVTVPVSVPVGLSSLTCTPTSILGSGSATCTVRLGASAPAGGAIVALSDNSTFVTTPASVTVAAGATTATFIASAATITTNGTAVVTASLNGTTATSSIGLSVPPVLSTLTCSPSSLSSGGSAACTVTLTGAAPTGGLAVSLSDNSAALTVPASVSVAAGATTASFNATAGTVTASTAVTVTVTATANSVSKTAALTITAAPSQISSLTCSPTSISSGAAAVCTVTLTGVAPTGGLAVALSDNNAALTVPASVSVAAGATTASFNATAGTVTASTAVTVTATANSVSKTAALTITAAPSQISSLACSPTSISSGAAAVCSVTLTGAAPTGGLAVALSDNNAALTVPASVSVAAGATTASFNATAGTVTASTAVTVTATANSVSKTASLNLTPAPSLTSLVCAPTALASGAAGTCTVTLSSATGASLAIAITDNSTSLTVPASVTVPASSSAATFPITSGTVTTAQTAAVTATLSGVSKMASISLGSSATTCPCSIWKPSAVPAIISDSDTTPVELGMRFRSNVAGYVLGIRFYKGSKNTGTHTGKLWSKGGTLLATVTFSGETASGWQQANFSAPVAIAANTTYVVSYWSPASHYSANNDYFKSAGVTSNPLYALKDGEDGASGVYKYSSSAFPTSTWKSSNYWVDVVFNTVASTTPTALPASMSTTLLTESAPLEAAPRMASTIAAASPTATPKATAPRSLYCAPKTVQAGDSFSCQLQLPGNGEASIFPVAAGSSEVRVPANIQARANQRLLTFRGIVDKAAPQSTFNVSVGEDSDLVEDQITILPSTAPVLSLPQTQLVKIGEPISFQVSAQDPSGLPVQISAAKLPAGASFQNDSGRFEWSPAPNQEGANTITFTAVNSSGVSSKSQTQILVDSGTPTVAKAVRALCSPGAVASLEGRWFIPAGENLTDPSGSSLELGGTKVRVNDTLAPVLFASQTRVDFLCPSAAAGSNLAVSLDTASGSTSPVQTTVLAARPNLLQAQGLDENQGLVTILGSDRIATVRDYRNAGEPAQIDDLISLRATGLGVSGSDVGSLLVKIGGEEARVESVIPSPEAAGVFLIQVRVPTTAPLGDEIPVSLQLLASDGKRISSNTITLAIE